MSNDASVKRKHNSPAERKSKRPRTSEGKKDKHSKARKSSPKEHSSSSSRHSGQTNRRTSDMSIVDDTESDDNASAVSPYRKMFPTLHMAVPPVFAADPARSVAELFDTMLLQYVPELEGVLVTHHASPKCFQRQTGRIEADGAFGLVPVKVECLVWSPRIGMKLQGQIILSSPSHVSLLLDGLFNASISSQHIDLSQWEFVHMEQDNDESAQDANETEEADVKPSNKSEDDEEEPHSLGYWRNKIDHSRLGGVQGNLTFTVVSMTVAKRMLTLHGSLLPRPFSVPPPDDQDRSADSMLPPMEGDARIMTASQKLMHERRMRLAEQRREQLQKAKEEAEATVKTQNKRVRWDDDESDSDDVGSRPTPSNPPKVGSAAAKRSGAIPTGTQGTKVTFDD